MKLQVEVREGAVTEPVVAGGSIMITPPINEEYWLVRCKVSDDQAIVAFPKFFTLGIGFANESDWNTNLPWKCDAEEIFSHISHNKGDDGIPDERCIEAIRMVQAVCAQIA